MSDITYFQMKSIVKEPVAGPRKDDVRETRVTVRLNAADLVLLDRVIQKNGGFTPSDAMRMGLHWLAEGQGLKDMA